METRHKLIGSTASPYAIKLRALMRYRGIPFDWIIFTKALRKQTEHLRPNLIPVLQYPDGAFRGETTMLAYDLGPGIWSAPSALRAGAVQIW
jgi:glutathione S-transferase